MDVGPAGYEGNSGVTAGGLFSNFTAPSDARAGTGFSFKGPAFKVIGDVSAEGSMHNYLGLITVGDTSYATLLAEAKANGADAVVDVHYDVKYHTILGLFSRAVYQLYGKGVKFVEEE